MIDWSDVEYFKQDEFDSPDELGSGLMMDEGFIIRLERVRDKCGFPFRISSGYRTPSHNAEVNGKPNSAHLRGFAADICIIDNNRRFKLVKAALEEGFRRIEVGGDWVHLDCDPTLMQDVMFLP